MTVRGASERHCVPWDTDGGSPVHAFWALRRGLPPNPHPSLVPSWPAQSLQPLTVRMRGIDGLVIAGYLVTAACVGDITGPTSDSETGFGPGSPPAPNKPVTLKCGSDAPNPGPALIRRLTHREYDNTLRDLFGTHGRPASGFGGDTRGLGFTTSSFAQHVSSSQVNMYADAALAAATALEQGWSDWTDCDRSLQSDAACMHELIESLGLRIYRRPLAVEEVERYVELFDDGVQAHDSFDAGVRWITQAMLQSPHFLYRVERGVPATESDGRVQLSSWEIATRLAYLVWASTPDEALLDAAEADALRSVSQLEDQLRRMMADPKAKDGVRAFHTEWLGLDFVAASQREGLTVPLAEAMTEESRRFAGWAFWQAGTLGDLLTAPVSFRNGALAELYGEAGTSSAQFEYVELDASKRAGILTQGSLMTLNAKLERSGPVQRGRFVLDRFLCQPLADPPDNVNTEVPPADPGETLREQLTAHSNDPACASCHSKIDPIGFAFEHYDALGRWRSEDNGEPVDASGYFPGDAIDGPFADAVELSEKLRSSDEVALCVTTQWFRYAMGRMEQYGDSCARKHVYDRFVRSGHELSEILTGIATSDVFRYRQTPEVP